jgi:hypothetical protein
VVLKVELDQPTFEKLAERAIGERRSLPSEAEVILMRVLGTWQGQPELAVGSARTAPEGEPDAAA